VREKDVARFKGVFVASQLTRLSFSLVKDLVDRTEALSAEVLKRKMRSRTSRSYVLATPITLPQRYIPLLSRTTLP
jgi:hypothetical protein